MAPDVRVLVEVRGVVALAAAIVPEAERHRRERLGADELAFLIHHRIAVLVVHLDRQAERAALHLAAIDRQHGVGVGKGAHDVGTAGDRRQADVLFPRLVYVVVALRHERRAGGDHHAERREVVRLEWPQVPLGAGIDELGRRAEMRAALLLGVVEQNLAATREGRAVVEHQARLGREPHEEHVPHHPVRRAVIEEAISRPHVEVQLVGLQALQERAARAMHDAFRLAGRAGGEEDEHRMLERQLRVVDVGGLVAPQPFVERHRLWHVGDIGARVELRHDHHLAQAGKLLGDGAHPLERVVPFAVVAIAVGAEQHLRLDLSEAIEHALDTEIGRAGRPDDALRQRRERQHPRLRDIRHEGRDAISGAQTKRLQCLRRARHVARQLRIAQAPPRAALVPKDEGVAAIATAQQILGEIEPRLGEPVRARHLVAVDQHGRAFARRDDAAVIPDVGPEFLRVLHRPLVELGITGGVELPFADHLARELRELRLLDGALARLPQQFRLAAQRKVS